MERAWTTAATSLSFLPDDAGPVGGGTAGRGAGAGIVAGFDAGFEADPGTLIRTCANCGAAMDERKCKLICSCGYFLSCSDYY